MREHAALTEDGRFAMERMVTAVRDTSRLLLPLAENPGTAWSESVRDVLAVALPPALDRDQDGFADADNDRDGRVDEDPGKNSTADGANGLVGIDDDGDGSVDEGGTDASGKYSDDDEDGIFNEDPVNGLDDDGDGITDEDPGADSNGDSEPGLADVDDDVDGETDEGSQTDDDEDGSNNEDFFEPVAFFLSGSKLMERLPNIDPVDGNDFAERIIADNVSLFRVERLPTPGGRAVLVDITLQVASAEGEAVALQTRVRVGGGP